MMRKSTYNADKRRSWIGGIASRAQVDSMNDSFWENATVEQKLDAMRTLVEDSIVTEGNGASIRLQRHIGGIRRLSG